MKLRTLYKSTLSQRLINEKKNVEILTVKTLIR